MFDRILVILVSLNLVNFISTSSIVTWLPNTAFNVPLNFRSQRLPCTKETVVFPRSLNNFVELKHSEIQVNAFVLPFQGEILLDESEIIFGADVKDVNCTEGNSYYIERPISTWADPGVWSSPRFTEATPDIERLPCYDDTVVFPEESRFILQLPDREQQVRNIQMGNSTLDVEHPILEDIVKTAHAMQMYVVNNNYMTGLHITEPNCQARYGCPCQENILKINCELKFCPEPMCISPIKPMGYCCSFCGGYISFDINDSFDMFSFEELVLKYIDGYQNRIAHHISLIKEEYSKKVQLVIIDKGEYDGTSTALVKDIDRAIHKTWYKGDKLYGVSGIPKDKAGLGGRIFGLMLLIVLLAMGGIYIYYYKLPNVRYPLMGSRSGGMFTRFNARSDSIVSLTRRDSGVMPTRLGFRNPLYDSKRSRVLVEESVPEEQQ